jgi:release factor glutamine methyltransferase
MLASSGAELASATAAALRGAGCVFAEDEARLLIEAARTVEDLDGMVRRRAGGEPLEVILGWAEFCGLRIVVAAGVFGPRQRTRFLVDLAAGLARPGTVVLDLCCGTGAIGAAIAARVPGIELHAADIEPAAVRCARQNVGGGRVYQGDLYEPLPASLRGRVDICVVNAPYVPTDEIATMPPEAREHEPRVALDGGPDGVDVHRRVAAGAPRWLRPGGHLLIETSAGQAPLTARAMTDHGLSAEVTSSQDLYCTVVTGTAPAHRLRIPGT